MFLNGQYRRNMHCGREHIVGALTFIYVIVRMHQTFHAAHATKDFTGAIGEHFIHIHVGLGTGTGLPDCQREFCTVFVGQHFIRGGDNRRGPFVGQQA